MSIVAVHGPNTFGSKSIVSNTTGSAYAIVNPANGLIWTLYPKDQSQVAANYDWTYTPAGGAPASPINDTKTPTITFTAGVKTVTLTLNGVAQPTFQITAAAGVAPLMAPEEEVQTSQRSEEPQTSWDNAGDGEQTEHGAGELQVGYDPAAHTVTEVIGFVEDNPDQLDDILLAEEEGKNRTTLISHLESMRQEP